MLINTDKSRDVVRATVFVDFLREGPKDDDELYFFVDEYLHLRIPRKSVCHNHTNHFQFLSDLYFERVLSAFGFGSRASGKTNTLAVLNFLDVLFKGVEVCSAGAILRQAEKCFIPGTEITMWNGKTMPIEDINVGDRVLTLNGKPSTVGQVHKRHYGGEIVGLKVVGRPNILWCTPDHEIFILSHTRLVDAEKTLASSIMPGDYCVQPGGQTVGNDQFFRICDVYMQRYKGFVYDLGVDGEHSYLANRIAVSNCYDYFLKFWDDPVIQKHAQVFKATRSETRLFNGGIVQIIAGTPRGLSGPHPNKARLDEVELLDWSVFQHGMSMSMTHTNEKGIWRGQDVLTSTRNFSMGTVQRLIDESESMGLKVFSWCIWEAIETCKHDCFNFNTTHKDDVEFKDTKICPLYSRIDKEGNEKMFCGGQAHESDGFYVIEDVIRKTKLLDWNIIQSQWLCTKPAAITSVYGEFMDEESHLISEEDLLSIASYEEIQEQWDHSGGIDFGGHHATIISVTNPKTGIKYWVSEHYSVEDILNEDHVKKIKSLMYYRPRMPFYADNAQKQDILEFRNLGIKAIGAIKDVFSGIAVVKARLARRADGHFGMRFLRGRVPVTVNQMCAYSYKTGPDGKVDRDVILKSQDHCPDAIRYEEYTPGKLEQKYGTRSIVM